MSNTSAYDDFGHHLHKAARLTARASDVFMQANYGISMTQYLLLRSFANDAMQPSQQALANHTGMSKSALSRQLSFAVKDGWLERVVSPTSRRQKNLTLSPKGLQLLASTQTAVTRLASDMSMSVSQQDLEATIRTLKTVCASMENALNSKEKL
jgi:DNA-binding MarR family transcriptional regulator